VLLQGHPTATTVGRVTAIAWPADAAMAAGLAELADQPARWPGLGRRDLGELRLVVTSDSQSFREFTRGRLPGWGAGAAFPGGRTIVLRADAGDVLGTLRHELAHLALHQAVRGRVPLWFDEGYATVASGQWDLFDRLGVNLAVARGATPGLRELDGALRTSRMSADAAYALAATAVLELARRNPTGTLDPLFERLEAGTGFEDAVLATTGLTLDRFDELWRRSVRLRFGLVTWMLGTGLWIAMAALLALAYEARRRRDRPRRAALDVGWVVEAEAPTTDTAEEDTAGPTVAPNAAGPLDHERP
jgi:predicted outer membrane lipoprotein